MEIHKEIFQLKCYNRIEIVELMATAFIPQTYIRVLKILNKYIFLVYASLNFTTKLLYAKIARWIYHKDQVALQNADKIFKRCN